MKITEVAIALDGNGLEEGRLAGYPCVWISFLGRQEASQVQGKFLSWIDWNLQGTLSRYLLEGRFRASAPTTFIPTMRKLPFPFLALEPDRLPVWDEVLRNCEGQGWKQVLCVTESGEAAHQIKSSCPKSVLADPFGLDWHLLVASSSAA